MEHSLMVEHFLNLGKRLMTYDYKVLDELLADDFIEFGNSGNLYDKKAQLDAVKGTNTYSMQFSVTDFKIKLLASDVLLEHIKHSGITIVNMLYEVQFGKK